MPATPELANRLKLYVSAGSGRVPTAEDSFIEACISEAVALVDNFASTTYVTGAAPIAPATVVWSGSTETSNASYVFSRDGDLVTVVATLVSPEDSGPYNSAVVIPAGFRTQDGASSTGELWVYGNAFAEPHFIGAAPGRVADNQLGETVVRTLQYITLDPLPISTVRVSRVPAEVLDRAYVEAGAELFHRKSSPQGISQFASVDGSAIRTRRDPLEAVRPMLTPFLPGGFA